VGFLISSSPVSLDIHINGVSFAPGAITESLDLLSQIPNFARVKFSRQEIHPE
jgi:hypothetical protein